MTALMSRRGEGDGDGDDDGDNMIAMIATESHSYFKTNRMLKW